MTSTDTERDTRLEAKFKEVAYESLDVIVKACRKAIDLSDPAERARVNAAQAGLSNYTRNGATKSAQRAIDGAMARHLADDVDGRFARALGIVMPDDRAAVAARRQLPASTDG